jgi:hypothetical protein
MPYARQHFRRSVVSVVVVQSVIRMWMYRTSKYLALLIQCSIVLQSRFRGKRSRLGYRCVLEVIACLQAYVRGWHTRRVWARFRQQRIIEYRRQIFELWERAFFPLIFRSKFWTFYQGMSGFRHLAIHEDELVRLWVYLGLKPLSDQQRGSDFGRSWSKSGIGINYDVDLGLQMGWKSQEIYTRFTIVSFVVVPLDWITVTSFLNRPFRKCLLCPKVQRKLDQNRAPEGKLLSPIFPEELKFANRTSEKLFVARKQLMIERAEIYEKLKFLTSEETIFHIYDLFHISRTNKKKKEAVVDMLCEYL